MESDMNEKLKKYEWVKSYGEDSNFLPKNTLIIEKFLDFILVEYPD